MNDNNLGDKIFKILQGLKKQMHIPDLHSFKAKIKNGVAFVEYTMNDEIYIEYFIYDAQGNEKRYQWAGTLIAAANKLEALQIELETIDM